MAPLTLKQRLGGLLKEWPAFEWRLRRRPLAIRNRRESLEFSLDGEGARCCWRWTTDLHLCRLFPSLGRRLMRRMLGEWPLEFAPSPARPGGGERLPALSFIIGHRGKERLDHLLATLGSIAAQLDVSCECIVVEQSLRPELAELLPAWVRYCHTPIPSEEHPYCRSWAFNVGGRLARGELLILHDNDLLIPRDYAAQAWRRFREGYEVINLKRFIFYLTREATLGLLRSPGTIPVTAPLSVMQNAQGGGSLAVGRRCYLALGGFDESFVGWGGEDLEFWDRALTLPLWSWGSLPLVHLWHPPQAGKEDKSWANQGLLEQRLGLPPLERIRELAARKFGEPFP